MKNKAMVKKLALLLGLLTLSGVAAATTGTEFKASADKFDGWIGGEYGRAAALGGTGIGLFTGMITKSFIPVLWGLGAAIGAPLIIGIINGSFTAVMPAVL